MSKADGNQRIEGEKRREAREWLGIVEKAVDRGVETAENVHRSVVDLPFEVLARAGVAPVGEDREDGLRQVTGRTVGAVYDLVRDINRRVSSLAADLLDEPETTARAES